MGDIQSVDNISDSVAWVVIRLCKKYTLKIILVYAPTSKSLNDDVEGLLNISNVEDGGKNTLHSFDFVAKFDTKGRI